MHRSPLESLHRAAGARFPAAADGGEVQDFGDVALEYRAGREGCALLDATGRGRLDVRGPDAGAFLQRLLANDVRDLELDQGSRNLLLTPKGKVLEEFDLRRAGDATYELSTHPGRAAVLAERLDLFLFADQVELVDASEQSAPLELCGPRALEVLEACLGAPTTVPLRCTRHYELGGETVAITALPVLGQEGWRLEAQPAAVPTLWQALCSAGATPIGTEAAESLRLENGAALWGVDVDDGVYPQEAHWEDAFSLSKGCFVGQEVVAKIDTYGGLNRSLVGLKIPDGHPVASGTELHDEQQRVVGRVTSCGKSPRLGAGLALGYVKVEMQEPGTHLQLSPAGTEAPREVTVVALPIGA